MPPLGGECSFQNGELTTELRNWVKRDGRGRAFDSFLADRGARTVHA